MTHRYKDLSIEKPRDMETAKREAILYWLTKSGAPRRAIGLVVADAIDETAAITALRELREMPCLAGRPGTGKTLAGVWALGQWTSRQLDDQAAAGIESYHGSRRRRRERAERYGMPLPEELSPEELARGEAEAALDAVNKGRLFVGEQFPRFKSAFDLAKHQLDSAMWEALEQSPFLILDDLGAEHSSGGWLISMVDGLINARYGASRRTIITTNLTFKAFRARYGERIVDRLHEAGSFVEIGGSSLRRAG